MPTSPFGWVVSFPRRSTTRLVASCGHRDSASADDLEATWPIYPYSSVSELIREIQATDLGNGTITAMLLQESYYLGAESVIIDR